MVWEIALLFVSALTGLAPEAFQNDYQENVENEDKSCRAHYYTANNTAATRIASTHYLHPAFLTL